MRQIQLTEWTFEGKQKANLQVWETEDTVMSKWRLYSDIFVCLNIFRKRGAPQKSQAKAYLCVSRAAFEEQRSIRKIFRKRNVGGTADFIF